MIAALFSRRHRAVQATLLAALTLLFFALPESVQAQDRTNTISVSGRAEIRTAPDMATVRFGIVTHDELPGVARERNAQASSEAMNAVRALGVEEGDMRLESLQLAPRREYDPDRRVYREDGFEATRRVEVIVRDLDALPDLIAAIVDQGANRLDGIQYGLADRDAAELEALTKAAKRARVKAEAIAAELGAGIGSVLQISEQGVAVPQPRVQMEMAMAKDAGGTPDAFAPGEMTVSASVTVIFSLTELE